MKLDGAACLDQQAVMFSPNPVPALALCAQCPVIAECETEARKDQEMWTTLPGVIAGKTSADRGVFNVRYESRRGDTVTATCRYCGTDFDYVLQTRRRVFCSQRCMTRNHSKTRRRQRATSV